MGLEKKMNEKYQWLVYHAKPSDKETLLALKQFFYIKKTISIQNDSNVVYNIRS